MTIRDFVVNNSLQSFTPHPRCLIRGRQFTRRPSYYAAAYRLTRRLYARPPAALRVYVTYEALSPLRKHYILATARSHAHGRDGLRARSPAGAPALSPAPVLAQPPARCAVPRPHGPRVTPPHDPPEHPGRSP